MTRRALLPVLAIVAAFALAACDGDAPDATPTATAASTAAPALTPTPTATAEAGAERLTGDPALDAVIRAMDEGDIATLAGLVEIQEVGCTHELGAGGPPKCPEGATEGDLTHMFPASSCEGYWTDAPVVELGYIAHEARGLYAVIESPDGTRSLVFHRDVNGNAWGAAVLVEEGRITSVASGCGTPPEDFEAAGGHVVAGPWPDMVEPEAREPLATGNGGVDATLAAVGRFDVNALLTGALDAMEQLPPVACVEVVRGPGEIECDPKNGEVEGVGVPAFPLAFCEGSLARDPADPLRRFLNLAPELVAVVEAPETPSPSALYPHGAYWAVYEFPVFFESAATDTQFVRLHLTEVGEVTAIWYGCNPTLDDLMSFEGEPLPAVLEAAR